MPGRNGRSVRWTKPVCCVGPATPRLIYATAVGALILGLPFSSKGGGRNMPAV